MPSLESLSLKSEKEREGKKLPPLLLLPSADDKDDAFVLSCLLVRASQPNTYAVFSSIQRHSAATVTAIEIAKKVLQNV